MEAVNSSEAEDAELNYPQPPERENPVGKYK
jgi:hypothetical protein